MDLVGACAAFVSVSDRGSFTLGAAAVRVPQSVASRRVAALEAHLGERLIDRSTRRASLTAFGRDILPTARRLVRLAETLDDLAERTRRRPMTIAVPLGHSTRALAGFTAAGRDGGVSVELVAAGPAERQQLLVDHDVAAAIVPVPPGDAVWSVPLGVAGSDGGRGPLFLETLRLPRSKPGTTRRRVWILPEDDVPHVRDRLTRVGDSVGLAPSQLVVAHDDAAATAACLGTADLLLCSARQADEVGLSWRPIGELHIVRGYDVAATTADEADRIRGALGTAVAALVGGEAGS
jgi:DNA-binding transcriptional LysR family regulator